ncbi:hypothetical protein ACLOJK_032982 [Asimina triloba]
MLHSCVIDESVFWGIVADRYGHKPVIILVTFSVGEPASPLRDPSFVDPSRKLLSNAVVPNHHARARNRLSTPSSREKALLRSCYSRLAEGGKSEPDMAGKQMAGNEVLTSHIAGMSKNQLYDVMSQMKVTLIEQNQQQAKQILVENPLLTKALFQYELGCLLGLGTFLKVYFICSSANNCSFTIKVIGKAKITDTASMEPHVICEMPNIQQTLSQQSAQPGQQISAQATQSLPAQASSSQVQISARQQQQQQQPNQPFISIPPASVPAATLSSQNMPHSLQTAQQVKIQLSSQPSSISASNIHNPPLPPHQQPAPSSMLQTQMPTNSSQGLQSLPPAGSLPLQPPLPPIPRPSMQPFTHQVHSQMGPNIGLQPPQQIPSRSMFHSHANPQASIGSSYAQGQPPLPNQPPPSQFYQVGSHVGGDFGSQSGSSMQGDRGAPWLPGPPEYPSGVTQPSALPPAQMGPAIQSSSRPPQLTPEMEKALLQQVMSLTPEQINLLPPEQRAQVFQLQQMLR